MDHRSIERLAKEIASHAQGELDGSGLVCMRTVVRNATGSNLQYGLNVLLGEIGLWEGRWLVAISPILLASPKEERFTIAHELAHWSLRDESPQISDLENVCDSIARAIIFPDIAILEAELEGRAEDHGWISDRYELPRRHVALRLSEFEAAFNEARSFAPERGSGVWIAQPVRAVPRQSQAIAANSR